LTGEKRVSVSDEGFNWCWKYNHAIDVELLDKCPAFCFTGCPYYGYRRVIVIEERKAVLDELRGDEPSRGNPICRRLSHLDRGGEGNEEKTVCC
jgi:hypothetical protein